MYPVQFVNHVPGCTLHSPDSGRPPTALQSGSSPAAAPIPPALSKRSPSEQSLAPPPSPVQPPTNTTPTMTECASTATSNRAFHEVSTCPLQPSASATTVCKIDGDDSVKGDQTSTSTPSLHLSRARLSKEPNVSVGEDRPTRAFTGRTLGTRRLHEPAARTDRNTIEWRPLAAGRNRRAPARPGGRARVRR